jgi:cellulose synthase (UDP-forming)
MKTKDNRSDFPKRSIWQVIVAVFLILFPLIMILVNGERAFHGILWQKPKVVMASPEQNLLNDNQNCIAKEQTREFGIYDPEENFRNDRVLTLEQIYLNWNDSDENGLRSKLDKILKANRIPVLTIEPWHGYRVEANLLTDIAEGKYDLQITRIVRILSGYPGKLYISWGHEMDQDLTKRYPWSGKDPDQYVMAYRYVHDRIDKGLKNDIIWIWSPVVKKGCEKYWPGTEYADMIGMPIYSYPQWDKGIYGHIRSFRSWFEEKSKLVEQFHKPLIIVELGVTGSPDYQTFWLQEAFEYLKRITKVQIVLFFHARDTEGSWGKDIATPDWRTAPQTIVGLVEWIKE